MTREIIDTDVLIGGPLDGKRIQAVGGRREIRMATETGGAESYHREIIAGEAVDFLIWRWERISVDDAIGALIVGYSGPPAAKA